MDNTAIIAYSHRGLETGFAMLLDKRSALSAIKVLGGKGFSTLYVYSGGVSRRKDAVLELLESTKKTSQSAVAEEAVLFLLDCFDGEAKKNKLSINLDFLSLALAIGERYRIGASVAESLVRSTAKAGFHGRFPDLPLRLLKRPPNAEEIVLLVSSYVDDLGCRSGTTEEKLKALIRSGLPSKDAQVQLARFDEFDSRWKEDDF